MEQLKAFRLTAIFCLFMQLSIAQNVLSGKVTDKTTGKPIYGVEVYNKSTTKSTYTNTSGVFALKANDTQQSLVFIALGYEILEKNISLNEGVLAVTLQQLSANLNEVVISQQKEKVFGIKNLKDVEGTAIYAGKKTEVILVDQLVSNKASGNPRQAFGQVTGLNIYETENAGLQLNIGGRGLDPNRTSNFNTRQNGYDISADVLGYPESYYTPPLEALEEIQIIRGAASLQYGTQFGGLVNFKLKQPNPTKELEWISRVGGGSFGLVNVFNSFSGTVGKTSYYAYHQFKKGDGFRPNSGFDSQNMYANLGYKVSDKTKISLESTYFRYTAQQAGGLTYGTFLENPDFSNRPRNFFKVDWVLLNAKLEHDFSEKTKFSLNIFTLDAQRSALGFRDDRQDIDDDIFRPRESIVDNFNNWGAEARVLSKYKLFNKQSSFLLGVKYYQSKNKSRQGLGAAGLSESFSFLDNEIEISRDGDSFSNYRFPNLNLAFFGEHIFKLTNSFSVTPGFRLEHINTKADGVFFDIARTGEGQEINEIVEEVELRENERTFVLLGIGLSYKPSKSFEAFANFSQNYRSVTFNDIQIVSNGFLVDPDITDETGYTFDIGVRGSLGAIFRYDANVFSLLYDNRIDVERKRDFVNLKEDLVRRNIGRAEIYGLETLFTLNISNWLMSENSNFHWQHFVNTSVIKSELTKSNNIEQADREKLEGNEIPYVPNVNFKTGIELGYKDFKSSLQYSFIGTQFTDIQNTQVNIGERNGSAGEIPAYDVLDFSAQYTYKKWTLEAGVNNLLDERYFTQRATGYPGPGIIPSAPRNYYAVLQFKF